MKIVVTYKQLNDYRNSVSRKDLVSTLLDELVEKHIIDKWEYRDIGSYHIGSYQYELHLSNELDYTNFVLKYL